MTAVACAIRALLEEALRVLGARPTTGRRLTHARCDACGIDTVLIDAVDVELTRITKLASTAHTQAALQSSFAVGRLETCLAGLAVGAPVSDAELGLAVSDCAAGIASCAVAAQTVDTCQISQALLRDRLVRIAALTGLTGRAAAGAAMFALAIRGTFAGSSQDAWLDAGACDTRAGLTLRVGAATRPRPAVLAALDAADACAADVNTHCASLAVCISSAWIVVSAIRAALILETPVHAAIGGAFTILPAALTVFGRLAAACLAVA
jgi:hypothetical protein